MALFRPNAVSTLNSCMRAFSTSLRQSEGAPSYVYVPPGSSVSDPAYFSKPEATTKKVENVVEEKESHHMSPVQKLTPSHKAAMLKLNTKRAPLAPQGGEHYLPSGCSISDPHYSIKDPVYYVDAEK